MPVPLAVCLAGHDRAALVGAADALGTAIGCAALPQARATLAAAAEWDAGASCYR